MTSQRPYARCERRDRVALITLDREDRLNALGVDLITDATDALSEAEADPDVRAAVLTGAGRSFSSGGDLGDVAERVSDGEPGSRLEVMGQLHQLILRLRDSRLPIVAAVHGPAYGAGFSTALACDLIVASAEARFCQVFVRRNLVPDLGSAWLLPRAVGIHQAKELMLLGEELTAARALELGLINRVVGTQQECVSEALALAERVAAAIGPTLSMAKALINRSQGLTIEDSMWHERVSQSMALGTAETLDAMRAFLEKTAR